MSIKPILKLVKNHQLLPLTASNALLKPFYQLNYLAAAKDCGLFSGALLASILRQSARPSSSASRPPVPETVDPSERRVGIP
jgi:hypothetical protein